jgi:hypothetical protein
MSDRQVAPALIGGISLDVVDQFLVIVVAKQIIL